MEQLEKFFEEFFLKTIPYQIPAKGREAIVKIAPWITLVVLLFTLPAVLSIFGLNSMMMGMSAYLGVHLGFRYYLALAVLAVQVVLMGMAIPGLMKQEKKGWQLVYYSSLVSAVHGAFASYNPGSLLWSLLGTAIGLYIIFQVKSYYKDASPVQPPTA